MVEFNWKPCWQVDQTKIIEPAATAYDSTEIEAYGSFQFVTEIYEI